MKKISDKHEATISKFSDQSIEFDVDLVMKKAGSDSTA